MKRLSNNEEGFNINVENRSGGQAPSVVRYKLLNNGESKTKTIKWTKKDLVYEKLAHNSKPHYIEVARIIKEMEEKKKCTFHPRVNDDGRRYEDP